MFIFQTKQSKQFPSVNPVPIVAIKQLADLKPTAFDDIPIQLKKALILNKCLPVSRDAGILLFFIFTIVHHHQYYPYRLVAIKFWTWPICEWPRVINCIY